MPQGNISIVLFDFSNSSLLVNWSEPPLPNGDLRYLVNVSSMDLFTGSYSQLAPVEVSTTSAALDTPRLFYVEYRVSVVAFTSAGAGSSSAMSLVTPEGSRCSCGGCVVSGGMRCL